MTFSSLHFLKYPKMASDNDEIFPHKRVPKPPITESGASLDSGLGPSIGSTDSWSCAWPDDPVQNPLPPVQHPDDLAGIDHRYYMSEEQIPQNLFDGLGTSLTLSERGSTTHPGAQLEQKRRRKDQGAYDFAPYNLTPRVCTSCGHSPADCAECCDLSEYVSSCHVCCNAPAHDMGACVARSKTISSPISNR